MKKIKAFVFVLSILLVSLAGCGKKESGKNKTDEGSFAPFTAIDTKECSVSVDAVAADEDGTAVTLTMENKTTDKTLFFYIENGSSDGIYNEPFFGVEVEAGKKVTEDADYDAIDQAGLSAFTDVYMQMIVCDSDDNTNQFANEEFHVYPNGKANATVYERKAKDTDVEIADNDSMSFVYIGKSEGNPNKLCFYMKNTGDSGILVTAAATDVNGQTIDLDARWYVYPDNCRFTDFTLDEDELAAVNVETWESVTFTFDGEDDDYNEVFSETTTIQE